MNEISSKKSVLRFLWHYVSKYRRYSVGAAFFVMISAIFSIAGPYAYKLYIDSFLQVQLPVDGVLAVKAVAGTLALYIVAMLFEDLFFEVASFYYMPFLANSMLDLLVKAYEKVMSLSFRFHASNKSGKLYAKIVRGERGAEGIFDSFMFTFISLAFRIPFFLILVAVIQGTMVLYVAPPIALFVVWMVWSTHRIQKREEILQDAEDRVAGSILDSLTNIESVLAFGGGSYRKLTLEPQIKHALKLRLKTWRLYPAVYVVTGFIVVGGFGVVFVVATQRFLSGAFSLGDVVFLGTALTSLMVNLYYFSHRYGRMRQSMTEFRKYMGLLEVEEEVKDPRDPVQVKSFNDKLELDNVSFTYGNNKKSEPALHDFSVVMPKGTITALVGHSGAGKTSIIKLLLRFYDVQKGAVKLDSVDVRDMTQADLHRLTSLVPQDPSMFHDTVRMNILFGRPDATEEEVVDAAKRANAHDFILRLPGGYNTKVGERGVKLSGGQRQRVAIARAILAGRPIVLLDEATSSLDSVSEAAIQKGLSELQKEATMVVIAHRLSTIQHADNIVVLDDGRLIDQGTHDELLDRCALYKELWRLQTGGFMSH